jgi:hypothetical protein
VATDDPAVVGGTYDEHKILVVGLPQTGKTTFLAALWDVVSTGEVADSLRLVTVSGEKQHLNELRDRWADCHEVIRTRIPNERQVSMTLHEGRTNKTCEVFFSDMSGESFEKQWTERVWTLAYRDLVHDTVGVLLFVHPASLKEARLIRDAQPLMKHLVRGGPAGGKASAPEGEKTVPPEPHYAATQVQLVELLQFIRRGKPAGVGGLRIAVIVSAWDLVLKVERRRTPETWLAERMPLLDQYLRAHSDATPFRVYGVSAQGGDLATETDRLRNHHRASERIIVQRGQQRSHDITAPVQWAMGILGE